MLITPVRLCSPITNFVPVGDHGTWPSKGWKKYSFCLYVDKMFRSTSMTLARLFNDSNEYDRYAVSGTDQHIKRNGRFSLLQIKC